MQMVYPVGPSRVLFMTVVGLSYLSHFLLCCQLGCVTVEITREMYLLQRASNTEPGMALKKLLTSNRVLTEVLDTLKGVWLILTLLFQQNK